MYEVVTFRALIANARPFR